MLDRLSNFCSNTITEIWTLIDPYYMFCKRLNKFDYIAKLLEKDKLLCDNIENINNQNNHDGSFVYGLINYS